jgi:hypothetical protein
MRQWQRPTGFAADVASSVIHSNGLPRWLGLYSRRHIPSASAAESEQKHVSGQWRKSMDLFSLGHFLADLQPILPMKRGGGGNRTRE